MNFFLEWIFWILKKMNICRMNILDFQKNEILFWMNILDLYKMNISFNKYFGFILTASKMVAAKFLKLIWNPSEIIRRTYFSPFQGVYYLNRGLRRAPKPYFGLILEFWIIFLIFLMNNLIEYSGLYWMNIFLMNIPDFVLNWIIFWPDSMKKWIFKTYRPGLFRDH